MKDKIRRYLEEATETLNESFLDISGSKSQKIIEIAKMIQLEDITDRAYKMHKEHESEDKNGEK